MRLFMASMFATSDKIFVDTSYLLALAIPVDQHHDQATLLMTDILRRGVSLTTSEAVLLEFGNALAHPKWRPRVVKTLLNFYEDPLMTVVPLSEAMFASALSLFRRRPDKAWGLTDCSSFEIMRERGLSEALTADEHFEQAGFVALLRR